MFRSHLQDVSTRAYPRFHIQRMQAGGAFSIASGGTTFARIAECGRAATQWLHSVQSSSFQMGISSAILRFSQRVVPIGKVPSRRSAETGRASPSPATSLRSTVFTKSGAASETTGGRLALCGFAGCNGTSSTDYAPARSLPIAFRKSWPLLL